MFYKMYTLYFVMFVKHFMCLDVTKPVFEVSDKARLVPSKSRYMIPFNK